MALTKTFEEMRKIDISKYVKKRDNMDYLPWGRCKELLHNNGADVVYWVPLTTENGSSLFMSDMEFSKDDKTAPNRCYETRIEIHIDDKIYLMQSPVMNGANPVRDNSMSQQRVWNSQCRSFVKGVAIYTGLGFDLWLDEDDSPSDDLSIHNINKIKQRVEELITAKIKKGLSKSDIAKGLGVSERTMQQLLDSYSKLYNFEKAIEKL